MLFNSSEYLLFLPVVVILHALLPMRMQNVLLLAASYFFYAWWDVRFLPLIALSTAINYSCGIAVRSVGLRIESRKRASGSAFVAAICLLSALLHMAGSVGHDGVPLNLASSTYFLWTVCMAGAAVLSSNIFRPRSWVIAEKRRRKLFLAFGIVANLSILGFFKYYNFFLGNVEAVLRSLGLDATRFYLHIILPVGVSFFTFKGISYLVDVYRGLAQPETGFTKFALFMAFFPALLAGPLDRANGLLPQFAKARRLTTNNLFAGLQLFLFGLFKKVVIADGVVRSVDSVFASSGQPSWIDVVVASVLFAVQIYCDFSGYTDMARGTAKFFGIDLAINFNLPYFSLSPREFWSRWHMSLSSWLRDYLYVPLGGNRGGRIRMYRNLMITMVLGGLWHGAAWNFVLWGFYHGMLLCIHRAVNRAVATSEAAFWKAAKSSIKLFGFFMITCYGWLLFRADSFDRIVNLSSVLVFGFGDLRLALTRPKMAVLLGLPTLLLVEVVEYCSGGRRFHERFPIPVWTAVYALMIFCLFLGLAGQSPQFIYFTF